MSYAFFTNSPAPTERSAHSIPDRKAIAADVGKNRLAALLVLAAGAEFLLVAVGAFAAAVLYYRLVLQLDYPDTPKYILESLLIATLQLLVSVGLRQYSRIQTQPRHTFLWSGVSAVFFVFSFFISTIFLLKISDGYSRATVMAQAASVIVMVLFARAICFSLLQPAIASGLIDARRVILIGEPSHCLNFSGRVSATGIRTIRSFDLPTFRTGSSAPGHSKVVEVLSHVRELIAECRPLRADDIVILTSESDVPAALALAGALSELPVDVHVVPVGAIDLMAVSRITQFGNMVTMRIFQSPLTTFHRAVKRAFDIAAAIVGLVIISPLFVILPLAIKLDSPGPVLFRQTRHGYNNETIRVLKFRSMTVTEEGDNFKQVTRHDPRVTRLGRFMRHTNIDELPQLFNVLVGDMSLVGPRPHATSQNESFARLISSFSRRHNVKPGITGWAQVNGYRGETDTLEKMQRRVEHDLYYIDNWSFLLDLKIIVMTLFSRKVYWNAF
ncbi:Undecaprenyl-phosphate glucose phosphotransferase [Bradyrhizobium japonicum]|uniref:Undecaprenyl-phosphate glucose phosphotransferase n=1 Tax=Bradyrhizobium elkanii TaxID=29448 RepID=A0ABV4FIJ5_BRAEL|nr:undecaprenyl-phosphate glucose phosphotransferase [Bradyrhizobium elkanii]MBP2430332.1 Undecaprenyl-phosphate glucose phosphotransferase [Bradyrhizobium elkanii]MCP1736328.1 Undecaprenyl-phosphate glucose phosphotransferase [Bradyrhizobium elkanii]MCP1754224.1 Undecaprenyl-phosphate glucose phosphotransferase [Bradyrhizobium elkanii]MCP1979744.1 Undecaprenyl-phosphate glucose phosphotransferase [Bradyrhizobium elkanii]MCS3571669.1 Undecaprenyl-phosphate glucose phosphotransferase [Bradyrhiz